MANIVGKTDSATFKIDKWLGLNQNPDGDTKLKFGEFSELTNWKITRDYNVKRRPGTKTIFTLGTTKVSGIWHGIINNKDEVLAACDGHLWKLYNSDFDSFYANPVDLGKLNTDDVVTFIPFSGIVYILNGREFYQYDGRSFITVKGYRPLIMTGRKPDGTGGVILERVNLLTGARRVWFSPDGTSLSFKLPEEDIISLDYVMFNSNGTYMDYSNYTYNKLDGTITFDDNGTTATATKIYDEDFNLYYFDVDNLTSITSVTCGSNTLVEGTDYTFDNTLKVMKILTAQTDGDTITLTYKKNNPIVQGTNTIEIGYTAANTYRHQVCGMKYYELYNGTQDTRIMLYGDGSNKIIYSDVDYNGEARADYFADLNTINILDENSPVTGIIRHFSMLIAYKPNCTVSISYGQLSGAEGETLEGFYSKPINRDIGNIAVGQVRLINNNPRTLTGKDLYEWQNNSRYNSSLSQDERNARRISDRIYATLENFDIENVYCFDDNYNNEYYIYDSFTNEALVNNYANDTWYKYTNLNVSCMDSFLNDVFIGTLDGKIKRMSFDYNVDDNNAINAYAETGSIDFNRPNQRKYSSEIWITIKPEDNGYMEASIMTDRRSQSREKTVTSKLASFEDTNYASYSFVINRRPKSKKLKLKAKKFVYYKLIFESSEKNTSATILTTEFDVRYTGQAK